MAAARMPDEFYAIAEHHLPPEQPATAFGGGRPRVPHRVVLRVIWFVLATGARWEDVPLELGCSGRTAHRRLRDWEASASRSSAPIPAKSSHVRPIASAKTSVASLPAAKQN